MSAMTFSDLLFFFYFISLFSYRGIKFLPNLFIRSNNILLILRYGSTMVKLDIDVEKGGMKLDPQFLVDFGTDKSDILLAHEMR